MLRRPSPMKAPYKTKYKAPRNLRRPKMPKTVDEAKKLIETGSKSRLGNELASTLIREGMKNPRVATKIENAKDLWDQGKEALDAGHVLATELGKVDPSLLHTGLHILEKLKGSEAPEGSTGKTPKGASPYMEIQPTTTRPVEGGDIYQRKLRFGNTWTSKRLKMNEDMYKRSRYLFIDSQNPSTTLYSNGEDGQWITFGCNTLFSQAGINRVSYFNSLNYMIPGRDDYSAPGFTIDQTTTLTGQNPFIERGFLPTLQQRFHFMHQKLMSPQAFKNFFDSDGDPFAQGNLFDLEFGIKSTRTKLTVYNRNPDYRSTIKCYVLKYKKSTNMAPQDLISNWETFADVSGSANQQFVPDPYVHTIENDPVINFPNPFLNPVSSTTGYPEYSTVPGATGPGFSPTFNAYVDVVEVLPITIGPQDKQIYEITIDYPEVHSLRECMSLFPMAVSDTDIDTFVYTEECNHYQPGDLALMITHCGETGTIQYTVTPPPPDDPIKTIWNADHTTSRIGVQWTTEYEWYTRDGFNPDKDNTTNYAANQVVQSTKRQLSRTTKTYMSFPFDDPKNIPMAGSNINYNARALKPDPTP